MVILTTMVRDTCRAMLSGVIMVVLLMCYCCHKSIRKNRPQEYPQYWRTEPDAHSLEVFTTEAHAAVSISVSIHFQPEIDRSTVLYPRTKLLLLRCNFIDAFFLPSFLRFVHRVFEDEKYPSSNKINPSKIYNRFEYIFSDFIDPFLLSPFLPIRASNFRRNEEIKLFTYQARKSREIS